MKVKISFSKKYFENARKRAFLRILKNLAMAVFLALLISALTAFILSYNMKLRLKLLSDFSDKIGNNEFGAQMDVKGSDEISELAKNFNLMSGKLAELENMKRTFMSSVSHELKSPLGIIETYIENLMKRKKNYSPEEKKYFARIKNNISRLSNFISNLLTVSKIEKGEFQLRRESCDISAVIRDVAEFFKPKAVESQISLSIAIGKVPALLIDREMISHVITNFLSNAFKFTPKFGKIEIKSVIEENYFKVSIANTGTGIKKEDQEKLFKAFGQIKNPINKKGTGLGLYLSKRIIDAHDGKIGCDSMEGKGAAFWFSVPLSEKKGKTRE